MPALARFITLFYLLLSASALGQFNDNITAIELDDRDWVIDADENNGSALYNRNVVRATVSTTFDRITNVGQQTETYRYRIELFGSGGAVQLDNGSGGTATAVYHEFDVTWNAGQRIEFVDTAISVDPEEDLDLNDQYRWEVELQREISPGTFTPVDEIDSGYRRFWHFTGTNPLGGKRNVLVRIRQINFTRRHALSSAAIDDDRAFWAEVEMETRRYDGWENDAPLVNPIEYKVDARLVQSGTAAAIPLDGASTATVEQTVDIPQYVDGAFIPEPYQGVFTVTVKLIPASQIDTASDDFYVQADMSHIEFAGGAYAVDETDHSGFNLPLLHFNGQLQTTSETATITSLGAGSDAADTLDGDHRDTLPVITGFIDGHPNFSVTTAGDIDVRLYDDGHAEIGEFPGATVTAPLPLFDFGTVNGIRFQRFDITLDPAGLRSDVTLVLPTGLGYYDQLAGARPQKLLRSRIEAGRMQLNQDLEPQAATTSLTADEVYFFCEESKPVEFAADTFDWQINTGRIVLGAPPAGVNRVRYVRRDQMNALNQSPLLAADKEVLSNELYFRHVAGTTQNDPTFAAGPLGSALTRVTVDFDPGDFASHFPYGADVAWDGTGQLEIVGDLPVPANSQFTMAQPIDIPWARDCETPPDAMCGTIGDALSKLDPNAGTIGFTRDGGLGAKGALLLSGGSRRDVVMGYIDVLSDAGNQVYAHNTEIFDNGSFLSAGHFVPTGETVLGAVPDDSAPGRLLNSGFNPNNLNTPQRPGTAGYNQGTADYAGVNFRVANEVTPPDAVSTLGGVESPEYTLSNRSKYYARQSGISGIHEPTENPFTDPLLIYDYEFTFTNFGLSFLSSEVHDSVTAGSLYIPGVETASNGFDVVFDELHFSCLGGLTNMKLDGGPFEHRLDFWDADILGIAAAFQPAIGAECDPSDAYFTLGVQASASNIAQPLAGTLGFKPEGNLITEEDALIENVDSRLVLPSVIEIKGPGSEIYYFYPAHHAYYDNFDHQTDGDGDLNFAGQLDVAFFEDLNVHFQTSGERGNTTAPIHMMGGWSEGGDTHFTSDSFDLDNRGYPSASNRTDYRAGLSGELPTAHQEWLDVVTFEYPLIWDTTTRSFRSDAPKTKDILVINTEGECTYLSAEVAEIDFGASIHLDIPEINFENLAEGTPVYTALHNAADEVTERMVDGLEQGEELLNDLMDKFYDDLFDVTIEPVIQDLAADLQPLADDAAAVEAAITSEFATMANTLKSTLDPAALPSQAVDKVDDHLAGVQDAIGAVRDDLLGDSSGRYPTAETALVELVSVLQPSTHSNLDANGGYDNLESAFDGRSDTLEDVKNTLESIDESIQAIRDDGFLADEIEDAFAAAEAEIDTFTADARDAVINAFRGDDLSEFTTDEISDVIREEIRDAFNASGLVASISEILRSYLYELDAAMHEAIDSGFQQINRVINDLLRDFLPVDSQLVGFLHDLSGTCQAANVDGYARINGDALRTLRLDTELQLELPDPFEFDGYIEINQLDSDGVADCLGGAAGDVFTEVKMGAAKVPVRWLGSDLKFDVDTKFSFAPRLRGMAGAFEMTEGAVNFEAMKINELGAAAAFGLDENYLAAKVGVIFDGNRMYGGVFFGRTCTFVPLELVDPNVANVLPAPPLTGIYAYGEAQIPIVNVGCLFRVSATAGAGIFAFDANGTDVIGGKMFLGADGRVICAVNAGGSVELIGAKVGNAFNFSGTGRIYGCAGKKPLKVSFDKSVTITYKNDKWDYDY